MDTAPMLERPDEGGWTPPATFDEYRIVRPLGRGSGGQVFLAHDTLLDRPVSVKFLRVRDDDASLARFMIEARAAARVQHPNVVTLYRVGQRDGRPYLVSEFVRGKSLDQVEKPLDWDTVLSLALALARGLAAAHRSGVLHRDLKPANAVLTEEGDVKLLDFGLAKLLGEARAGRTPAEPGPAQPFAVVQGGAGAPEAGAGDDLDSGDTVITPERTSAGLIMGTPHYMSPEAWRGEEATPRSDLYSLGALLYELCSGAPPHHGVRPSELLLAAQCQDPRALLDAAPSVHPALAAIIHRCLRRDAAERFASAEELYDALEALAQSAEAPAVPLGQNPFRGLQPFEAEHRAAFFGRRREISLVLERLRTDSVVVLTGDSGVGKSSLCLAGVLPAVAEDALGDRRSWKLARVVPGRSPLSAVAGAIADALGAGDDPSIEAALRSQPEGFVREVRARLGSSAGLLIYLDQLEELVTQSSPESARAVSAALGPIAGMPGLKLLATARSDFLTRLSTLPGLGEQLPRSLMLVRPLGREEIREAVVGPTRAAGGRFESEALVDELVRSAAGAQGGLPLLQFALAELWEVRDRATGIISAGSLETIGGVAGALARHAEGVLLGLVPEERRAARAMLLRLVTAEGTRARRTEQELAGTDALRRRALEALVRGRLLVARENEESAGTSYEIAHEALLTGCRTLAGWLGEQAETRALRERLAFAASEWERLQRPRDLLAQARLLAEAARLDAGELGPRERDFLAASRRAARKRAWARRAVIAGAVLAVPLVLGGLRLKAERDRRAAWEAQHATGRAALREAEAAQRRLEEARGRAFGLYDKGDWTAGESEWRRTTGLLASSERAYLRAESEYERLMVLGGQGADARPALGEMLLARAVWAERERRHPLVELFLQRLRLHDPDGERAFFQPASLAVETQPAGARVQVEQYVREPDGRMRLVPVDDGAATTTPLELALRPGSYLLTLNSPGRPPVRYPVVLERAERRKVQVRLPSKAQVPPGFVYVPPGRSSFGSGDDEGVRQFFNAPPLHAVESTGFLIARNETTYADWIEYLRALPERERRRRVPKVSSTGLHGSLSLTQKRGKWRLRIQPNDRAYEAVTGERIRYGGRTVHAEHDWLKLPVSGISWADAQAYMAWLSRTGRVRGARPCTEVEWERAGRGADDRAFPHGERLEPNDANFDLSYGKDPRTFGPDEVGSHPASRSPFEIDDMAGNVWEWVRSAKSPSRPVARGGSYYFAASSCRLSNREEPEPTLRDLTVGVRVCASLEPSV